MTEIQAEKHLPKNVLVIMPHADDIEFGVAGSAAKWIAAGAKVTYCIVTNGISGSNDADADLGALVQKRREEQLKAADIIGVDDVCFLDYQDGILQPTLELRRDLTRLIRRIKPDRVVCFDPTTYVANRSSYINHPDHRAAGEAALYAVFPSAETRPIFPELLEEGLEPHKVDDLYMVLTDKINTYVDITAHIEPKLAALRCHESQLNEEVVQMVRGWNEEAGKKFGCGFAEVFRVMDFRREEPSTEQSTSG